MSKERFVELVSRLAEKEGENETAVPQVKAFRVSEPRERQPVIYEPCIMIAACQAKVAYLAERVFRYDDDNYLVLTNALPLECVIPKATPAKPYLAIKVHIDPVALREVVLALDEETADPQAVIRTSTLSPALRGAAIRLLESLEDPVDARVLGPLGLREIYYRVARGPQGEFLRALALGRGKSQRIARVLKLIHARYAEPLDVTRLAREAHLGVSTLHHAFKAATAMAPLQYIKTLRLHQARSLMLHQGLTASEASYRVGYNSPSQFSREFKRLFRRPPTEERERLRVTDDSAAELSSPPGL